MRRRRLTLALCAAPVIAALFGLVGMHPLVALFAGFVIGGALTRWVLKA